MENWAAAIAALIGAVVLPFVVNLCANCEWGSEAKRWLAIGMSLALGIVTGIAAGLPTPETLVSWALGIVGAVQVAYTAFKSVGITDSWLESLMGIGNTIDKPKS